MKKKLLIGFLLTILLLVGLVVVMALTFSYPKLRSVGNFEPDRLIDGQLQAKVELELENPNFFGLSAKNLQYFISYRDTLIAQGESPSLWLPAHTLTSAEFTPLFDLKSLFLLHKGLLNKDSAKMDLWLEGQFTFLGISQALKISQNLPSRQFLSDVIKESFQGKALSFSKIRWKPKSLNQSEFSFVSTMQNPLQVPLVLKGLKLQFSDQGLRQKATGDWTLDHALELPAGAERGIDGKVEIENLEAGKDFVGGVFKGEFAYFVWGKAVVSLSTYDFELPVEGKFIINPLTRSGKWESL